MNVKKFSRRLSGHKCGNCPRAEKAEELKEIYGDQLIPIAIHAGFSLLILEEISLQISPQYRK